MATVIIPYTPPLAPSTTSTSSTTTSTLCTSTIVTNVQTLSAYKGIGIGIPGFTYQVTSANSNRVQATGYIIKSLPLVADGILYLNNVAVTLNQVVSPTDNGKLVYVPKTDADAQATFTFAVQTNCGTGSDTTITINVTTAPNPDNCNCSTSTTSSTSTTTV